VETARQIPPCVLFCRRYSFLLCSCKFDFSLCLSFFSAALRLSPFLHLSSSPSSSSPFSVSLLDSHTHTHTHSQTLSLVVEFIVWSVSPFSPSVLPFVFCMFACIVHRGRDADRMQTVCPMGEECARAPSVSIYQDTFVCLHTTKCIKHHRLFEAQGVHHQRDLMRNVVRGI